MQDDKLKLLLINAEVRPPRRVWRNISSRLDSALTEPDYSWMKWAGVAVVFACMVLGVFLFNHREHSDQVIAQNQAISEQIEIIRTPEQEESVMFTQNIQDLSERGEDAHLKESSVKLSKNSDFVNTQVVIVNDQPSSIEEDKVEDNSFSTSTNTQAKSSRRFSSTKKQEPQTDYFAQALDEEKKSFRPHAKALYLQSSIGGNDSDIRYNNFKAQLSNGTAIQRTGIKELGESVFGVPFSVGAGVRFYLLPKFSVGTGLKYSLLTRTFEGRYQKVGPSGVVEYSQSGSVLHSMHYLGIPLNLYYDIISTNQLSFYAYGGGEMEYCVANKYLLRSSPSIVHTSPVNSLQWSIGGGLGVEFKLTKHMGLYFDPSARFYFHCDQPKNVRTERPLMFNLDAGIRFDF